MVKISNEKISEYLGRFDESSRKELISLLSENKDDLKNKFKDLKESTIIKLNSLKESENDLEVNAVGVGASVSASERASASASVSVSVRVGVVRAQAIV